MRTALYARVSCRHQDPSHQLGPLRAAAAARGATSTVEFVDHGVSGRRGSRPALDRMMAAVRAGRLDLVLVTKIDRAARSVRHLASLVHELAEHGVALATVDGAVDTGSATGRFVAALLGAVAELELSLQHERVEAARANGHPPGRPRALTPESVERARALLAGGASVRSAARQIGASLTTLRRALAA